MIQQDYIMRLIKEFMDALALWLENAEAPNHAEMLKKLYEEYVGHYDFYYHATLEEVLQSFATLEPQRRLAKIEMLAELYYASGSKGSIVQREFFLRRAFALFDILNTETHTFSIERQHKQQSIVSLLGGSV